MALSNIVCHNVSNVECEFFSLFREIFYVSEKRTFFEIEIEAEIIYAFLNTGLQFQKHM